MMAQYLKVSVRKLYRIFQTEYNLPPHEMVIKQRIALAAGELSHSSKTISLISYNLGYQSIYSFSNLFKKHMGMRPSEYRKKFFSDARLYLDQ